MKAADQATGRLPGDTCDRDWIWDREVETEDHARALARGEAAWEQQWRHLMESSAFYRRRFGAAGIGPDLVRLTDISRLPLTSKADLKEAIDELPPFGTNLCVPEERVKRVYQTSGTSGAPSHRAACLKLAKMSSMRRPCASARVYDAWMTLPSAIGSL